MRLMTIFQSILVICLSVSATSAQVPSTDQTQRALALLTGYEPSVKWNRSSAVKADFNSDGNDDFAFSGTEGERFVVAIVNNPIEDKPKHWTFRFSIVSRTPNANQICSGPVKIETGPPMLIDGDKFRMPAEGKALFVGDACGATVIAWNPDKKDFQLLRSNALM